MTSTQTRLRRARALHATVALAAALAACGDDDDTTTTESTDASAPTAVASTTETIESSVIVESTVAVDGFTFTPPEGDYSVVFPAEPSATDQTVPLPDGTALPITFHILESGGGAFGTAAVVYPAGTVVTLEGSRDGAIANISATLIDSAPITQQGRDGLQFSASLQDGQGTYLSRIFADGVRLYQVIDIVSGEATFDDSEVAAFFDSFRFTEDR